MEHTFEDTFLPLTSVTSGRSQKVAYDVTCLPLQIVNVCFVGNPRLNEKWVLVDAGMPRSADEIIAEAEEHFRSGPQAIILTHGHFDHVGAIAELVKHWNVPVYAHELELPYLTGQENYPPADPTVDGGLVSELSPFFPNQGIDLDNHVTALPSDGSVPGLPGWRWIHTPGHTPGHISLFRDNDHFLIAGDAFVTVKQESLYKVIVQEKELSGPPKYFTTDWQSARDSVKKLEALQPRTVVTGHGRPMYGAELTEGLKALADNFDRLAVPKHGRYVH